MCAVEGINGFQPQAWGFASALATPSQGVGYLEPLYMQYRICQEVDVEEKEKRPKKTHLKPSALFYKCL